jgi:hypothetical protein
MRRTPSPPLGGVDAERCQTLCRGVENVDFRNRFGDQTLNLPQLFRDGRTM